MFLAFLLIVVGFIFLIKGADFLVEGASNIAKRFHTTVDNIVTTNNLASDTVRPGDCLILVKEIVRA